MKLRQITSTRALLLSASLIGFPASAGAVQLVTLGDSITFGVGSDTSGAATTPLPDDGLGGYRYYLDQLLSPDFTFVGNRNDGSGIGSNFADNAHFGIRSGEAANDKTDGSVFVPSTLTGIFNAGPGTTSPDAAFNSSIRPNGVLLHIGVNSLPKSGFRTDKSESADGADTRLQGDISLAVDQFNTLLDGDESRPDGLVSRLTDTDYFAPDAHLFVALIPPRLNGDTSSPNSNEAYINRKQGVTTAQYNSEIKSALEARMVPGGDLEGRVTFVDLFSISIDELNLQALADEFFDGDLIQLDNAINPDDDTADGSGLDYVDWTSVVGFDEGDHNNGAFDFDAHIVGTEQDLLSGDGSTGEIINANTALLGDGLHPTNLGYAITSQVWSNAINGVVPEPSAITLLLGAGLIASSRRRRCRC